MYETLLEEKWRDLSAIPEQELEERERTECGDGGRQCPLECDSIPQHPSDF